MNCIKNPLCVMGVMWYDVERYQEDPMTSFRGWLNIAPRVQIAPREA